MHHKKKQQALCAYNTISYEYIFEFKLNDIISVQMDVEKNENCHLTTCCPI